MDEEKITEDIIQEISPPLEEDFKDKYFRLLAEMENMRKRMAREKQDMIRFAIENAIAEFLPIIDQFENALRFASAASGEIQSWAIGFQMFLGQFKEVLEGNGITSFTSVGQRFDPALHEAVEAIETTDVPEGTILQEFTKGYKSPARVIRPARVKVAKTPTTTPVDLSSALEEQLNREEIYE
jgi:molecular chaperone GrpE